MKAAPALEPLLVSEHEAAALLGISFWTIREYVAAGLLPVVSPPSPMNLGRKIRRKLIDRRDIDAFIREHKQQVGGGR